MRVCYTIVQLEPEGFPGTNLLYKSDAANTLPLSGAERSLRVQKIYHSCVLLDAGTFVHVWRDSLFNGEDQLLHFSSFSAVFASKFKTLDLRTARSSTECSTHSRARSKKERPA